MRLIGFAILAAWSLPVLAQQSDALPVRAQQYLADLIRCDTTNPPGNETRAAEYIRRVLTREGIPVELLGDDPERQNVVARLKGSGEQRPLLLMAHTDVVPADRGQWSVDPFTAEIRDGYLYGRGAQDDKSLLAAEMAVFVELKRRGVTLRRDVILLAEADEEAGSTGIQWLIQNAYSKIDAEFALNEGGYALETPSGVRVFHIQTSEKIPTRMTLVAHGTAGHGSLPLPDNAVVRLSRAIVRLAEADQPVRLNATTRRYFRDLAKLPDFAWLHPLLPRLEDAPSALAAASTIRSRDRELDAMLRTTVSPTMLNAGMKVNVIPNRAEAQIDVRRLPNESAEEVFARFRETINDNAIDVVPAGGQEMPATEPSSISTALYQAMEGILARSYPRRLVVPYMVRGATDGAFLRQKGMAVYGVPVFFREDKVSRAHGNDERISLRDLGTGANLLWKIVSAVAGNDKVGAE